MYHVVIYNHRPTRDPAGSLPQSREKHRSNTISLTPDFHIAANIIQLVTVISLYLLQTRLNRAAIQVSKSYLAIQRSFVR